MQDGAIQFFVTEAVVQITGASEKRRIHQYLIVLKGLPSK